VSHGDKDGPEKKKSIDFGKNDHSMHNIQQANRELHMQHKLSLTEFPIHLHPREPTLNKMNSSSG